MDEQEVAELYGLSKEASADEEVQKKDWHKGGEMVDSLGQTGRIVRVLK